jgi:hypothetical protein
MTKQDKKTSDAGSESLAGATAPESSPATIRVRRYFRRVRFGGRVLVSGHNRRGVRRKPQSPDEHLLDLIWRSDQNTREWFLIEEELRAAGVYGAGDREDASQVSDNQSGSGAAPDQMRAEKRRAESANAGAFLKSIVADLDDEILAEAGLRRIRSD